MVRFREAPNRAHDHTAIVRVFGRARCSSQSGSGLQLYMYLCGMVWRVHAVLARATGSSCPRTTHPHITETNEPRATGWSGWSETSKCINGWAKGRAHHVREGWKCVRSAKRRGVKKVKIKSKNKPITHLDRASTISRMSGADAGAAVRSVAADAEVRAAIRM